MSCFLKLMTESDMNNTPNTVLSELPILFVYDFLCHHLKLLLIYHYHTVITWTNVDSLSIGAVGINFCKFEFKSQNVSQKKMHLKISSENVIEASLR